MGYVERTGKKEFVEEWLVIPVMWARNGVSSLTYEQEGPMEFVSITFYDWRRKTTKKVRVNVTGNSLAAIGAAVMQAL